MEDVVFPEVLAHDLTHGVDAPGHRLEGVRKLDGLEPMRGEPEAFREAVGALGVIGPTADGVTEDVDPKRSGAGGARRVDRREDAPFFRRNPWGTPLVSI